MQKDRVKVVAAFVRKTLLKTDTGNITIFAFDKGQGLRWLQPL